MPYARCMRFIEWFWYSLDEFLRDLILPLFSRVDLHASYWNTESCRFLRILLIKVTLQRRANLYVLYAGFCDFGHFYSVEPDPWSLDFRFHTFSGGFLALSGKAHLETLQKWRKFTIQSDRSVKVESLVWGRTWVRRPRLPQPPLELLRPPSPHLLHLPSELLQPCVSVYLCICVSGYQCICVSVYLCICVSVYLCICDLCVCVSVYWCICVSVYLWSVYLCIGVSVYYQCICVCVCVCGCVFSLFRMEASLKN